MGATEFPTTVTFDPKHGVDEAFRLAVAAARYEHGHGGYTGTIAEKHSFKIVAEMGEVDDGQLRIATDRLYAGLEDNGCLIDDDTLAGSKWGPAAAITFTRKGKRLVRFFGWASLLRKDRTMKKTIEAKDYGAPGLEAARQDRDDHDTTRTRPAEA